MARERATRFNSDNYPLVLKEFGDWKLNQFADNPAANARAMAFNPTTIATRPLADVVADVELHCFNDPLYVAAGLTNNSTSLARLFKKYGPLWLVPNAPATEEEIAEYRALPVEIRRLRAREAELVGRNAGLEEAARRDLVAFGKIETGLRTDLKQANQELVQVRQELVDSKKKVEKLETEKAEAKEQLSAANAKFEVASELSAKNAESNMKDVIIHELKTSQQALRDVQKESQQALRDVQKESQQAQKESQQTVLNVQKESQQALRDVQKESQQAQKESQQALRDVTETNTSTLSTNLSLAQNSVVEVSKSNLGIVECMTAAANTSQNASLMDLLNANTSGNSFLIANTSGIGLGLNESRHLIDVGNHGLFDEEEEKKNTLASKILPTVVATAPARGTGLIASDPKMPAATTLRRTDQPVTAGSLSANPTTTNTGQPVTTENPAAKHATGDDTTVAVENGKIGAKETAAAAAKQSDATAAEKSPTTTANQAAAAAKKSDATAAEKSPTTTANQAAAAAKKSDATAAVKSPTTKANQAAAAAAKQSDATAAVTSPTTKANQAAAAAKKSDATAAVKSPTTKANQAAAAAAKKSDATAAVTSPTTKANQAAAAAAAAKKSDNDQDAVERNGVSISRKVFLFFLFCLIFWDSIKDLGQKVPVVQINSVMFGLITKLKDFPQHADDVVNKVRNLIQALFPE